MLLGILLTIHIIVCIALLLIGVMSALPCIAQDSGALVNALIRKGILTTQEAEDIRADLVREAAGVLPQPAFGGGRSTDRLSVGMRAQLQYAGLDRRAGRSSAPTKPR